VDDDSTLTYNNFTIEYAHFEGAGGVGCSLPLSMSTAVPEPPPTSAPCSPAIVKHKSHLVARIFVQREGIDFDDTFAPVARMESMRLLIALAAQEGWRVHHMDVKSVFLNGDLKEEVYMHQPPGFAIPGKEGKVLRLCKALYGLRQAPRTWNAKLDTTLKGMGFG
jgi:hypothetical protein